MQLRLGQQRWSGASMAQLFGLGMKRLDTFAGQVATLPQRHG